MTRRLFTLALLTLVGAAPEASAQATTLRDDIDFARRKVYPALVNISVISKSFSDGRAVRFPSAGSGVVVSPAGHVLTNYHVCQDAVRVYCTLPTGERLRADIVASDAPTDLAVLSLRLGSRPLDAPPIPFATFGDSDALGVGDYVLAVGNPLSLASSMTLGIVSNTKRVFTNFIGTEVEELDFGGGNRTGMFTQWIQHDALILPGNSGGPLVNLKGEIVGINTRGGSGVGFASPSKLVSKVLNQVVAFGQVKRGWVGLSILPVSRLGREKGALVSFVVPSSPADRAGIVPGDVIISMNGDPVAVRFFEEVPAFYRTVADLTPGKEVAIKYLREDDEYVAHIPVAPMEKFVGEEVEIRSLGIAVQDITAPMSLARRYPSDRGVLLTSMRPGHPFEKARPRFEAGDVILSVDGQEIEDLDAFRKALDAAAEQKEIVVGYRRDREHIVTVVDTTEASRPKPGGELAKAWLGVRSQVLMPRVAKALGIEGKKGFRITEVLPWSPAAAAGLRSGDVITAIDDEPLDAYRPQDAKDLQRAIEEFSVGEPVEIAILRDGDEKLLEVELGESPASAVDVKTARDDFLEVSVREITMMDKTRYHWDRDQQGAIVVESTSGGWAAVGGLRANDLIVRINEHPIKDPKSFEAAVKELAAQEPKLLQFFVRRGYRTTFVFVEPDWTQRESKSADAKPGASGGGAEK